MSKKIPILASKTAIDPVHIIHLIDSISATAKLLFSLAVASAEGVEIDADQLAIVAQSLDDRVKAFRTSHADALYVKG